MKRFDFKRFGVVQDDVAMPLTTDSVLIGAWADIDADRGDILDVGTGCGVIALMAAQRTENKKTEIDAIDIDDASCSAASLNVASSPWGERMNVRNISLQDLAQTSSRTYGHIISNPPFFSNSLKAPDSRRTAARHTDTLSFDELMRHSAKLLNQGGLLTVIIPADQAQKLRFASATNGFTTLRQTEVFTKPETDAKRVMLEFIYSAKATTTIEEQLFIYRDGTWSTEYMALTKDFYLNF